MGEQVRQGRVRRVVILGGGVLLGAARQVWKRLNNSNLLNAETLQTLQEQLQRAKEANKAVAQTAVVGSVL